MKAPARGAAADYTDVKVVSTPAASSSQPLYAGNREPLLPSPFVKLPIGSITPKGWVRQQLMLEAHECPAVNRQLRTEDLQCDRPVQGRLDRPQHDAHPAATDNPADPVVPQLR